MIKQALEKDKTQLYQLWQNSFSVKSNETLNSFFNIGLQEGKTILCEMDEKTVATVFMHDMDLQFHGKCLKSVFLSHVATHPDYRKSDALDNTLKSVLDECEKKALFTFVEATSYKFWENYGFQEAIIHRYYELNGRHFENVSSKDVREQANPEEMKEVYDTFMKHFDGYKCRSVRDFEILIQESHANMDRIFMIHHLGKPKGYIIFHVDNNQVRVKEIIYLGSNALLKLCKAALAQHDLILLELSEAEHIEKLFPLAIPRKRVAYMVRCNNFPLFNKLYNCKVKTSKDAYALSKKPKYLNEKY